MISENASFRHWNYFLALESDLAQLSRFVEFTHENYATYSIEMVRLLLATASEVDVVLRQHCARVAGSERADDMERYRRVCCVHEPKMAALPISVPRFGLELTPWINWQKDRSPEWWADHNKVKHERGAHFSRANLKNVLNAMGGLFVALIFYYRGQVEDNRLVPAPDLFMAPREVVNRAHSIGGETGLFYADDAR